MATLQDAITLAEKDLNDPGATRYPSDDLLRYANDALDAISLRRPELFYDIADILCTPATVFQTFATSDSHGLVDILFIKGGNAVREITRKDLDNFTPAWPAQAAGPAENWMRLNDDPYRFLIYPAAPPVATQTLVCQHISVPLEYSLTDTHRLPNSYTQIIAVYIKHRAHARDSKDGNLSLSAAELEMFYKMLGVTEAENAAKK